MLRKLRTSCCALLHALLLLRDSREYANMKYYTCGYNNVRSQRHRKSGEDTQQRNLAKSVSPLPPANANTKYITCVSFCPRKMPSSALEDSALSDMDDDDKPISQAEKLSLARAMREMSEKFDAVITRFVVDAHRQSIKQSLSSRNQRLILRDHFQCSPRFYDTYDCCVSAKAIGRMQHRLVAEYHEKPQLWMSPDILADFRRKISRRAKSKWRANAAAAAAADDAAAACFVCV